MTSNGNHSLIVLVRALLAWIAILALEVLHGIARTIWLVPAVGDLAARQIGVVTGSLLILLVAFISIRWIGARRRYELLAVGFLWLSLMLVAELTLGRWAFGFGWSRIAEDFDPSRGGFLGFGLLVLVAAPWLARRLRGPRTTP